MMYGEKNIIAHGKRLSNHHEEVIYYTEHFHANFKAPGMSNSQLLADILIVFSVTILNSIISMYTISMLVTTYYLNVYKSISQHNYCNKYHINSDTYINITNQQVDTASTLP